MLIKIVMLVLFASEAACDPHFTEVSCGNAGLLCRRWTGSY